MALLAHSTFSPRVHQCLVRLGIELPFERVPDLAWLLLGVAVSAETVRRLTEAAGAAQVEREAALRQQVRDEAPAGPVGPAVQQLSADGAMVPVVGGEWTEVRTLALGTVEQDAAGQTHATKLRYFSRHCSAADFIDWVELPLHEAGTAQAGTVVAVQDGADWLTQLVDAHCPEAVRILDFPHAAEYLTKAAQAAYGVGTAATTTWLDTWCHELKHGDPDAVIAAVRTLPTTTTEGAAARDTTINYLSRRRQQITYATFQEQGYPIGSGAVESANKLVVEQRLKGSGMHWSRANLTPMLALRGILCTGRWDEVWPVLWRHLCGTAQERRRQHWVDRRAVRRQDAQEQAAQAAALAPPKTRVLPNEPPMMANGRPTADHIWRRT